MPDIVSIYKSGRGDWLLIYLYNKLIYNQQFLLSLSTFLLIIFFQKKSLDISRESSAWQTIHMICQDFSLKKKIYIYKKECRLLQILFGVIMVNHISDIYVT